MSSPGERDETVVRYLVDMDHESTQQQAAYAYLQRLQVKGVPRRRWLDLALTLTIGAALLTLIKLAQSPAAADVGWALLLLSPLGALLIAMAIWQQRAIRKAILVDSGPHPYEETLRIGTDTLSISNPRGISTIPLRRVVEVEQLPKHLMLHLRAGVGILVPESAFANEQEREGLISRVRQVKANSPLPPGEGQG
jgi:hypothetical protein